MANCIDSQPDKKTEDDVPPPKETSINATLKTYGTDAPMSDVVVVIQNGGVSTPYDTTGTNGKCTLPNVTNQNVYHFEKPNYITQSVQFESFSNLSAIDIFMKTMTSTSIQANLQGVVYNSSGKGMADVWVVSGRDSTRTDSTGHYTFNVPRGENKFPIHYEKNGIGSTIKVEADQDTVEVDVFIDGITVDTLNTTGQ